MLTEYLPHAAEAVADCLIVYALLKGAGWDCCLPNTLWRRKRASRPSSAILRAG